MSLDVKTSTETKFKSKLHELAYEASNMCIQCGYCLPVCPTYDSMGSETQSPRGRINLVKLASEGKINIQTDLAEPIDFCLGCRACEIACPVNVPYGEIYTAAREIITQEQEVLEKAGISKVSLSDKMSKTVFKQVFPSQTSLRIIGNLTWFYQRSNLDKIVHKFNLGSTISRSLGEFEKVLPQLESPKKRYKNGDVFEPYTKFIASVAFFPGCIMDAMMSKINRLTIELLRYSGYQVVIPNKTTCCGALHAHQGMTDNTRELAIKNMDRYEQTETDYYVNNAGGCGAMLVEYDTLFDETEYDYSRAKRFGQKMMDVSELLVHGNNLPYKNEISKSVTYQDSCHLRNVQGVIDAPRKLLNSIPKLDYQELETSNTCCASGGIYNLVHYDESMKILDKKMDDVKETHAKIIVTTNPGCLLQMNMGVKRSGLENDVRSLHLIELLAEACEIS